MLFPELRFLVFFLVVLGVHWALRGARGRKLWLLGASYLFYAAWDWRFLGLILASTVVDFVVGRALDRDGGGAGEGAGARARRAWLALSLAVNLGLLGTFKYLDFFLESAAAFAAWLGLGLSVSSLELILPVGISFYTFQTLSYTLDVYRGRLRATRDPLDFALFVAFFPQLVAGPIVRARAFLPQLEAPRRFAAVPVRAALLLFLFGYVKKACVADRFGLLADQVFAAPEAYGAMSHWLGLGYYTVQIYGDFSGYSDMAIATAALLGYRLPRNFQFPYLARSLSGFWRRWHISLSGWFRDYLYVPLGGSRVATPRVCANLLVTFVVSGLWHGASWNFVAWGALHGMVVVAELLTGWGHEGRRSLAGLATTNLVWALSLVLFRTTDLAHAGSYAAGLVGAHAGTATAALDPRGWLLLAGFAAVHVVMSRGVVERRLAALPPVAFAAVLGALAALALPWASADYQPFLYFQF